MELHEDSQAFLAVLEEARQLHLKKQQDYGREGNPFANVKASEDFGMAPWVGAMVRANDKMRRLQAFARKGELANESAEDSLIDLLVYTGIALVLYRQGRAE